ncbi:MAG: hypothetical protein MK213_03990, partial [Planctomycetes bacterium]|nr:hypothetical protein [Planctomycetota bacterium]
LVGVQDWTEFRPDGSVVGTYPPQRKVLDRPFHVRNPASGVKLHGTASIPGDASPQNPRPLILFVPGADHDGSFFKDLCESWARLGYIAVRFDPDGRGDSTNQGTYLHEDWGGRIQQVGLHHILLRCAGMPEVNPEAIVVRSEGYGITMAAGALARFPDDPPVALLMDLEGPATRDQSSYVYGGPVPVDPHDAAFWSGHEALPWMGGIPTPYVRIESEEHAQQMGSHVAVSMLNAAVNSEMSDGVGQSSFVLANGPFDNPSNIFWRGNHRPQWLPDSLTGLTHLGHREHLLMRRVVEGPQLRLVGGAPIGGVLGAVLESSPANQGRSAYFGFTTGLVPGLDPWGGWTSLDFDALFLDQHQVHEIRADGRALATWHIPYMQGLVGLHVFFQAAVLREDSPHPLWYTSVEALTIQP